MALIPDMPVMITGVLAGVAVRVAGMDIPMA